MQCQSLFFFYIFAIIKFKCKVILTQYLIVNKMYTYLFFLNVGIYVVRNR